MRFKLVESFDKLNSGILATDSPFTIKNLIINKPCTYRILYDESIDTYFIGDGELLTHFDLLGEAYNSGYYYQVEDYINELGGIQFYYKAGENKYLYFLVFDNMNNWNVGDDGFDTIYKYDCGNMLGRACDFSDTELYKILESHLRESLYESKLNKDFSAVNKFYRLEVVDAFGDNCGGLFTSKALWNLIYDEDSEDDEEIIELESAIDELQSKHKVPEKWLDGKVRFAFKEDFFVANKELINKIDRLLNLYSHSLVITEVKPGEIVFEDDTQIAYLVEKLLCIIK